MTSTLSARAPSTSPALVALIFGALAMGVSPIAVRLADVGPFTSAFWRVFLALPVLCVWTRFEEQGSGRALIQPVSRPVLLAGLAFAGDLFFWHLSLFHTTVANATFFATSAPLWVVIFGWLLFRKRVHGSVLVGLMLCLAGGSALILQSVRLAPDHVIGDLYGVVTGIFFGLYFLAVRAARGDRGAARVTFEMSVIAATVLAVVALVAERQFLAQSAAGWMALVVLAWVSHAGGQGLLSYALGHLPAVFSSLVIFLEAIAAAVAAALVLGEAITVQQGLGGLLIVSGIWVARPRSADPGDRPKQPRMVNDT